MAVDTSWPSPRILRRAVEELMSIKKKKSVAHLNEAGGNVREKKKKMACSTASPRISLYERDVRTPMNARTSSIFLKLVWWRTRAKHDSFLIHSNLHELFSLSNEV